MRALFIVLFMAIAASAIGCKKAPARKRISTFMGVDPLVPRTDSRVRDCSKSPFAFKWKGERIETLHCIVKVGKDDRVALLYVDDQRVRSSKYPIQMTMHLNALVGAGDAKVKGYVEEFAREYGPLANLDGALSNLVKVCTSLRNCVEPLQIVLRDAVLGPEASLLNHAELDAAIAEIARADQKSGADTFRGAAR